MNRLLLCTDCSPNARSAIKYAIGLFSDEPKEYFLLNTYMMSGISHEEIIETNDNQRNNSQQCIYQEFDWLKGLPEFNAVSTKLFPRFGKTANVVHRIMDKYDVDMAILGAKGKSNTHSDNFGSVTKSVMEKVPFRKMVVPLGLEKSTIKRIVVIMDSKRVLKKEWWLSIPFFSVGAGIEFSLVILAENKEYNGQILSDLPVEIRSSLKKVIYVNPDASTNFMAELCDMVKKETPDFLSINVSTGNQIEQLLTANTEHSFCDGIPFIIHSLD